MVHPLACMPDALSTPYGSWSQLVGSSTCRSYSVEYFTGGSVSQRSDPSINTHAKRPLDIMWFVVTAGCFIYPHRYAVGYLTSVSVSQWSDPSVSTRAQRPLDSRQGTSESNPVSTPLVRCRRLPPVTSCMGFLTQRPESRPWSSGFASSNTQFYGLRGRPGEEETALRNHPNCLQHHNDIL